MEDFTKKYGQSFKKIIDEHLLRLELETDNRLKEMHGITGITSNQFTDWFNGVRPVGRDRINQICYALAGKYEATRKEDATRKDKLLKDPNIGVNTLDGILNEMLEATGYSPTIGARRDQVWTRLSGAERDKGRTLRIAVVEYPPFVFRERGEFRGVAIEIMRRVAKLMGADPKWVESTWGNVIDKIVSAEVDVVAPILLELPSRMFQVAFSDPLPGIAPSTGNASALGIPISGLIKKDRESEINTRGLCLNYVKGEAGQALCTMFFPDATATQEHDSLRDAYDAIQKQDPDGDEPVNCLVADHVICKEQERISRGSLKTVSSAAVGGVEEMQKLPIAAGVHLEEPQLLQVLNRCLGILRESKWFETTLWQLDDGKQLMQMLTDVPAPGRQATEPIKQAPAARAGGRKS